MRLLALTLALLSLAGLAGALEAVDAPRFEPVDAWRYEGVTETPYGTMDLVRMLRVDGHEEIRLDSGPVNAVRLELRQVMQTTRAGEGGLSFTTYTNATQWLRASDLAELKTTAHGRTMGLPFGGPQEQWANTTFSSPCPVYEWPLEEGRTWTATCEGRTDGSGGTSTQNRTASYAVGPPETIESALGEYEAFPIRSERERESETTWFAPEVCNAVRSEHTAGNLTFTLELTAVRCAATGLDLGGLEGPPIDRESNTPLPGLALMGFLVALAALRWKQT